MFFHAACVPVILPLPASPMSRCISKTEACDVNRLLPLTD